MNDAKKMKPKILVQIRPWKDASLIACGKVPRTNNSHRNHVTFSKVLRPSVGELLLKRSEIRSVREFRSEIRSPVYYYLGIDHPLSAFSVHLLY